MTRDKDGQGFVPGFLQAAASTPHATEGNLPGELFNVDRLRNMERTPEDPGAMLPGLELPPLRCGRCGAGEAAGAAGLCLECNAEADDRTCCHCGRLVGDTEVKGGRRATCRECWELLPAEPCDCPRCSGVPPCPDCDGFGSDDVPERACPTCGGSGLRKGVQR